jgi:hypothetical protein
MTRAELLEVVYRFYPRDLPPTGPEHDGTEEAQRQRDALRCGAAAYPTWKAMLGRLSARYPVVDESRYLLSGVWYSAYSAGIEIPGRRLGFHVSLLGPYYGVHRTGLPIEGPAALDLAREIEATFPGYAPIPRELGDEVVPDVSPFLGVDFGKATLNVCLLSDLWDSSSEPWPPPDRSFEERIASLTDDEREALAGLLGPPRRSRSGAWAGPAPRTPEDPRRDEPDANPAERAEATGCEPEQPVASRGRQPPAGGTTRRGEVAGRTRAGASSCSTARSSRSKVASAMATRTFALASGFRRTTVARATATGRVGGGSWSSGSSGSSPGRPSARTSPAGAATAWSNRHRTRTP